MKKRHENRGREIQKTMMDGQVGWVLLIDDDEGEGSGRTRV